MAKASSCISAGAIGSSSTPALIVTASREPCSIWRVWASTQVGMFVWSWRLIGTTITSGAWPGWSTLASRQISAAQACSAGKNFLALLALWKTAALHGAGPAFGRYTVCFRSWWKHAGSPDSLLLTDAFFLKAAVKSGRCRRATEPLRTFSGQSAIFCPITVRARDGSQPLRRTRPRLSYGSVPAMPSSCLARIWRSRAGLKYCKAQRAQPTRRPFSRSRITDRLTPTNRQCGRRCWMTSRWPC